MVARDVQATRSIRSYSRESPLGESSVFPAHVLTRSWGLSNLHRRLNRILNRGV